jgi:hypothetical protein
MSKKAILNVINHKLQSMNKAIVNSAKTEDAIIRFDKKFSFFRLLLAYYLEALRKPIVYAIPPDAQLPFVDPRPSIVKAVKVTLQNPSLKSRFIKDRSLTSFIKYAEYELIKDAVKEYVEAYAVRGIDLQLSAEAVRLYSEPALKRLPLIERRQEIFNEIISMRSEFIEDINFEKVRNNRPESIKRAESEREERAKHYIKYSSLAVPLIKYAFEYYVDPLCRSISATFDDYEFFRELNIERLARQCIKVALKRAAGTGVLDLMQKQFEEYLHQFEEMIICSAAYKISDYEEFFSPERHAQSLQSNIRRRFRILVTKTKSPQIRAHIQTLKEGFMLKESLIPHVSDIVYSHESTEPEWDNLARRLQEQYPGYNVVRLLDEVKPEYYAFKGMWSKCEQAALALFDRYGDALDPSDINRIAWFLFLYSTDPDALKVALRWSKRSVDMAPDNCDNIDTYANLLYKTGDFQNALQFQRKAIDLGGSTQIHTNYEKMRRAVRTWKEVID